MYLELEGYRISAYITYIYVICDVTCYFTFASIHLLGEVLEELVLVFGHTEEVTLLLRKQDRSKAEQGRTSAEQAQREEEKMKCSS